ncbi:negative elongation factor A isoform X1 [Centruroides vittatus]|uniref:negative elongation factor A isoform X1 n=2 Tax=Centruroides vittatus TaxID=120091 RepID=UPI003510970F
MAPSGLLFSKMAHVKDSDTSLWLHNKLGTSNDLWLGGSICSQLSQDVLRNIRECFIELQSQVKLKLLLSFLHIPRRNVDEWKVELEEILEVALVDSDQWVSMLAELLKSYPSTGTLNFQIEENITVFTELIGELKKLVRKHSDQSILPLECLYLNRNAFNALVGQQPQPVKHFALKRKPKSAALRAELLQKSSDAAANIKKTVTTTSVPIRCRGLMKNFDSSSPLKGISNRISTGGLKSPLPGGNRLTSTPSQARSLSRPQPSRKDGGIKLLDITEQPIGYGREAKRRKKHSEIETPDSKKDKEVSAPSPVTTTTTTTTLTTPDYAVGLVTSTQLQSSAISVVPNTAKTTAYVPTISTNPLPSSIGTSVTLPVTVLSTTQARDNFQQTLVQNITTPSQSTGTFTAVITKEQQQPSLGIQTTIGTLASIGGTTIQQIQPQQTVQPQVQQTIITQNQIVQPKTQQQPQKKNLSLSREQMFEAQEMFRNTNRVTRPEKALILGFMAGSRENPCPHLGSIVTIKLSENEETVVQPDGTTQTLIVETHFQMNYSTGEWKRVKKYRKQE